MARHRVGLFRDHPLHIPGSMTESGSGKTSAIERCWPSVSGSTILGEKPSPVDPARAVDFSSSFRIGSIIEAGSGGCSWTSRETVSSGSIMIDTIRGKIFTSQWSRWISTPRKKKRIVLPSGSPIRRNGSRPLRPPSSPRKANSMNPHLRPRDLAPEKQHLILPVSVHS